MDRDTRISLPLWVEGVKRGRMGDTSVIMSIIKKIIKKNKKSFTQ